MIRQPGFVCLMLIFSCRALAASSALDTLDAKSAEKNTVAPVCGRCHSPKGDIQFLPVSDSKPPLWNPTAASEIAAAQDNRANQSSAVSKGSGGAGRNILKSLMSALTVTKPSLEVDSNGIETDHPVDVSYSAALGTVTLAQPVANPDRYSPARTGVFTATGVFLPLFDNKVQCETCHDYHGATGPAYLRVRGDALCKTCHPF